LSLCTCASNCWRPTPTISGALWVEGCWAPFAAYQVSPRPAKAGKQKGMCCCATGRASADGVSVTADTTLHGQQSTLPAGPAAPLISVSRGDTQAVLALHRGHYCCIRNISSGSQTGSRSIVFAAELSDRSFTLLSWLQMNGALALYYTWVLRTSKVVQRWSMKCVNAVPFS
jgi:hypothetical protein